MIEKTVLQHVEDELGYALGPHDTFRNEVASAVRGVSESGLESEIDTIISICQANQERDWVDALLAVSQALVREAAATLTKRIADAAGIRLPIKVYGDNPTTWPVQLIRTDATGKDIDPRRLVYVWGYACADLDFQDVSHDRARVLRLHDVDGTLAVYWTSPPSPSDADAIALAWSRAGGETAGIVEHWVEGEIVMIHGEEEDDE